MQQYKKVYDYSNPIDVGVLSPKMVNTKNGNSFWVYEGKTKAPIPAGSKLSITDTKEANLKSVKAFPKLPESSNPQQPPQAKNDNFSYAGGEEHVANQDDELMF